jgi:thiol:disulfide interchange protein DsbD
MLLLAFAGGLILNLMPCVFPVLGIKVMGFVQQAGAARGRVVLHGLSFTAGVLLSFWLLAAILLLLRAGGAQLGWGFQLQEPAFVYVLALFLFAFALNLGGLFEVGQAAVGVGGGLATRGGLGGSFASGILATVVATPCAAPFLAPALGAALTLPAAASLSLFTSIAVGLAAPYLLLSAVPALVRLLPRPGAWMETFKQAMSFLLHATVAYLVWVLAGQLGEDGGYTPFALLLALGGLVLTALACWVYGRWSAYHLPRRTRLTGSAVAALVLLAAVASGWPRPLTAGADGEPALVWHDWMPGRAEELAASGRIVYVDFTARWCVTCQTNKIAVFSSGEVRTFIHRNEVVLLRADWTRQDPRITAELERHGRSAVPFNLVYRPDLAQPLALPELLTPAIVLDALQAAR